MFIQVKFEYNLDFESLSSAEVPRSFSRGVGGGGGGGGGGMGVESKDWGKDPPRHINSGASTSTAKDCACLTVPRLVDSVFYCLTNQ